VAYFELTKIGAGTQSEIAELLLVSGHFPHRHGRSKELSEIWFIENDAFHLHNGSSYRW
jgi:hypothetical protein